MAIGPRAHRPDPGGSAMTESVDERAVACPYCGGTFIARIDPSEGDAEYFQDCEICCRPIRFRLTVDATGGLSAALAREDDV